MATDEKCVGCASITQLIKRVELLERELKDMRDRTERDVSGIRAEMIGLSQMVGRIETAQDHLTKTLDRMVDTMQEISASFRMIAGLPETWSKIQGFWSVMLWLRTHIIPLGFVAALFIFASGGGMGNIMGLIK